MAAFGIMVFENLQKLRKDLGYFFVRICSATTIRSKKKNRYSNNLHVITLKQLLNIIVVTDCFDITKGRRFMDVACE